MKKLNGTAGIAAVCFVLTALFCATALAETETPQFKGSIAVQPHTRQVLSLARVTLQDAAATASAPGHVGQAVEAELEVENGFLVYEFDFLAASGTHTKVLVDAGNGKLLVTYGEEGDADTLGVEEGDGDQAGENGDHQDGPDLTAADAAKAKVSLTAAVKAALAVAPGRAVAAELDRENGALSYEVDILSASSQLTEVEVNAVTGKAVVAGEEKERGGDKENGENEEEGND